jgi:hypothetical protein
MACGRKHVKTKTKPASKKKNGHTTPKKKPKKPTGPTVYV